MSIEPSPDSSLGQGQIVIDGISYIPSSVVLTGIPKWSIKDDRAFAVLDPLGQSPRIYSPSSELGVYWNDTRFIGIWETTFNGEAPVPLSQELRFGGNTLVVSMTNRDFPMLSGKGRIPRDTFLIRRVLSLVEDTMYETIEIKNFSSHSHEIQVEQWVGSRFEDIFEVRGMARARRGKMLPPEERDGRMLVLSYEGLDGRLRRAFVHRLFDTEKIRLSPSLAGHFTRVVIPPKRMVLLKTVISFDREADLKLRGVAFSGITLAEKMALLFRGKDGPAITPVKIDSDNSILTRAIENAQVDIFMLLTREAGNLLYPYAGIPWFSAPFGRDGIITAYQLLPWAPNLARGVLGYIFERIGQKDDPFTDEEPGKIFHEMRLGEMAKMREVPYVPYFGSVDSTPLALILLYEYIRWTRDLKALDDWWDIALRALGWVTSSASVDRDGFIGYHRRSPTGLVNQGWKDSHDSVMHANGRLAATPIKLCEVQGYSYAARMGMAALARLRGESALAERLRRGALELKARFMESYWDVDGRFVALALDGVGEPCRVRASNMGHCLWSQILPPDQARDVATALVAPAFFSGYGVRTLADTEVSYNPLSYHNGSVWPHDNSIIMEGLRNYGFQSELETLSEGLIATLQSSEDFRLPELFCGFRRRDKAPPVPYEVACKPQAWSAGALFLMLKAMLGLSMDADQAYFTLHSPILTSQLGYLEIRGLRCRDSEFDLFLRKSGFGTRVETRRISGGVKVMTVR